MPTAFPTLLPCRTITSPVAAAARPISNSRGSGSWQTPSLFSLSHDIISKKDPVAPSLLSVDHRGSFSDVEVFVSCSRTLSACCSARRLRSLCPRPFLVTTPATEGPETKPIALVEGLELTTAAPVGTPKPSSSTPVVAPKSSTITLAASLSGADTSNRVSED
ncbi:hypothetical protein GW17_00059506 [Ensete ventricosum]|nr:hypothetical protein GW17_00059506 [Ensete ventricosum]